MAGKPQFSDETAQEWAELYRSGESCCSIAREHDVSHTTVSKYIRQLGVEIRSTSEQKTGFERDTTAKASESPSLRDLEWAAGFIEGEGHIRLTATSDTVTAAQNDRSPLRKLQRLFGGNICEQGERCHSWTVYGSRARGVMMTLYPLMSVRRQRQIAESLSQSGG